MTSRTSRADRNCNYNNPDRFNFYSYGKNVYSLPTTESVWAIAKKQFDDFYVRFLLVLALISLAFSFYSDEAYKWLESVSIFFAVFFAAIIQASCDYGRDQQFLKLAREIRNEKVTVIRGPSSTSTRIQVEEIVVGDIIILNAGDRVPADCILVEEMDMFVDQHTYFNESYVSPDDDHERENQNNSEKQCSYGNVDEDI